jgi:hypothetical protein
VRMDIVSSIDFAESSFFRYLGVVVKQQVVLICKILKNRTFLPVGFDGVVVFPSGSQPG